MNKVFKIYSYIVVWGMVIVNSLPIIFSWNMPLARNVFAIFYGCVSVGYAIIFIRELFGERERDVLINSFAGFGVSLILTVVNARPYPFADLY
jgi:hypothetical protein